MCLCVGLYYRVGSIIAIEETPRLRRLPRLLEPTRYVDQAQQFEVVQLPSVSFVEFLRRSRGKYDSPKLTSCLRLKRDSPNELVYGCCLMGNQQESPLSHLRT